MSSQFRISLIYLIISALWILFSDSLVILLFGTNPDMVYTMQTVKGWVFITITAFVLYGLIQREFAIRQRAEDRLRRSETVFRELFMNNPLPMWIYDLKTLAFLDVNDTAVQSYGFSRDEFLHMTIKAIRPPEDIPRLMAHLAEGRPSLQESHSWRHRYKNGRVIYVQIISHTILFEGREAVLVVAQDITETIQTTREIQRTSWMLQSLVAASPLAIHVLDLETRVKLWSPASETIFGWTEAEVLDKPLITIPPELKEETDQIRSRVLAGETLIGLDVQRLRKDGSRFYGTLSLAPLYNDEQDPQRVTEIMGIIQDVTERKLLEADRQEKGRLQAALNHEIELRKLRNRFISLFSHEFRNPLTAISTSVESLEHYYDRMTPESRAQRVQQVNEHIQKLVTMLNDVVAVMKSETTILEFKPEMVQLPMLIQQVIDEVRLRRKQLADIQFSPPPFPATVKADAKLLRYAVDNVINNAVKYSPEGSQIDVWVDLVDEKLRIHVRDQGIGITEEDLPHLFESFARGRNVGDIPGTGLGLVIVSQAMELHGGSVEVTSREGAGTTFILSLPLKPTEF